MLNKTEVPRQHKQISNKKKAKSDFVRTDCDS